MSYLKLICPIVMWWKSKQSHVKFCMQFISQQMVHDAFLIANMTGAQNLRVATMILWMHKMVVVFWYLCMQSSFPTLNRIYEAHKVLPAFQASVPERQPDAKVVWGQSLCHICTATMFGRTCNTNWKTVVAILWPDGNDDSIGACMKYLWNVCE